VSAIRKIGAAIAAAAASATAVIATGAVGAPEWASHVIAEIGIFAGWIASPLKVPRRRPKPEPPKP